MSPNNSDGDHAGKLADPQEPKLSQVEAVEHGQVYNIDPAEERTVVRKLDCVIMPLMAVVYFFQCESRRCAQRRKQLKTTSDI